jgi:hypothetical protein
MVVVRVAYFARVRYGWFLVLRRFLEFNTKVYVGNTARNQCFLLTHEQKTLFFFCHARTIDVMEENQKHTM